MVPHLVASFLALFGPLFVFALALGGLEKAGNVFDRAGQPAAALALAYIATIIALAVVGALYVRGRRISAATLYGIALVPYLTGLGGALVHRRFGLRDIAGHDISEWSAGRFVSSSEHSGGLLSIAAAMSAFAMLVVALAALQRRLRDHSPPALVTAAFASVALFANVSAYALASYVGLRSLWAPRVAERIQSVSRASTVIHVSEALAVLVAVVLAGAMVRLRERAIGAMVMCVIAAVAAPWIIHRIDMRPFRVVDPASGHPDVHIATTESVDWRPPPLSGPTVVIGKDGPITQYDSFAVDRVGLVADRDATFATLRKAQPADDRLLTFALYLAPSPHPDAAALGPVGVYIAESARTADIVFTSQVIEGDVLVFLLEGATARLMRGTTTDLVIPMGATPADVAARRAALATIKGPSEMYYIAPRDEDTLSTIWLVAEDLRATDVFTPDIRLTTDRRTNKQREAAKPTFDWRPRGDWLLEDGVKFGATSAQGLPDSAIDSVLGFSGHLFRDCAQDLSVETSAGVRIAIARDGTVTSARAEGPRKGDKKAIACIVKTFKDIQFSQPPDGAASARCEVTLTP